MSNERSFIARHLRVLSLQLMQASTEICAEVDPILQPTWLSMLARLAKSENLTVMDAARETDLSHVHVQHILKAMKKAGVVSTKGDPADGRRTFYRLTKKGRALLPKVARLNAAILKSVKQIQAETGEDLFVALTSFQGALKSEDWKSRVTNNLNPVGETKA
jgi:DNA-binding MarR family transcriptional regulator